MRIILIHLFIFMVVDVTSQLKSILLLPNDSNKVKALLDAGYSYEFTFPDSAIICYQLASQISQEVNYPIGHGRSLNYSGIVEFERGNYIKAKEYYQQSIQIFSRIDYSRGIAANYNNIGNIYLHLGEYEKAVESYLLGTEIFNQINDTSALINNYNNIGAAFHDNQDYQKSITYRKEALRISIESTDTLGMLDSYQSLANTYKQLGDTLSFKNNLEKARALVETKGDLYISILVYNAYCNLMSDLNRHQDALLFAKHTFNLAKQYGNPFNISEAWLTLGEKYNKIKKYALSHNSLDSALVLAQKHGFLHVQKDVYQKRAELFSNQLKYNEAFSQMQLLEAIKDSLFTQEKQKVISELEVRYQLSQKESMIASQKAEIAHQEEKVSRQRSMIIWILITVTGVLFTVGLGLAFIQQRRKALKNQVLALEQQKEIENIKFLMQGEEKERSRLAQELHDGVNGSLGAVKIMMSSQADKAKNSEAWKKVMDMMDDISNEVREISHNLMPDVLQRLGLDEAIRSYVYKVNQTPSLKVDYQVYGALTSIPNETSMMIYRIIQELIKNVVKHAKASECLVQINKRDELFSLIVEDNGVGFSVNGYPHKNVEVSGIGLNNIYNRVELLGGKIDIQSTLQVGTSVQVDIPLKS